jgi:hypothetical protein
MTESMTDQDQPLARQRAKAPTIFDVAKQAGVSIKTVSRVVNAEINVRESTREKVLAAISDLNYRPNTAARVLSGKRFYVIGLIYENPNEFSYVQKVLNGALKALYVIVIAAYVTQPRSNPRCAPICVPIAAGWGGATCADWRFHLDTPLVNGPGYSVCSNCPPNATRRRTQYPL